MPKPPDIGLEMPPPPFAEGEPVYLHLGTQQLWRRTRGVPEGFYLEGRFENGGFVPQGGVLGEGPMGADDGVPGWLELANGQFCPDQTGRPPFSPFVKGRMTAEGFVPSSRALQ